MKKSIDLKKIKTNKIKKDLLKNNDLEKVVTIFKALGDLTRVRIITALFDSELSVTEITKISGISQPAVSHHLSILKQQNLVSSNRHAQEIHYYLSDNHISDIIKQVKAHVSEKNKI